MLSIISDAFTPLFKVILGSNLIIADVFHPTQWKHFGLFHRGNQYCYSYIQKIKGIDARQRSLLLRCAFQFIYYKSLILFYLIFFIVLFRCSDPFSGQNTNAVKRLFVKVYRSRFIGDEKFYLSISVNYKRNRPPAFGPPAGAAPPSPPLPAIGYFHISVILPCLFSIDVRSLTLLYAWNVHKALESLSCDSYNKCVLFHRRSDEAPRERNPDFLTRGKTICQNFVSPSRRTPIRMRRM